MQSYDIITAGGGLGGSTLAKAMAERGARVLVVERETHFKDRVRGEATVDRYVKVGVTHFIFMTFVPYNEDEVQRFAEEVMPQVRAR